MRAPSLERKIRHSLMLRMLPAFLLLLVILSSVVQKLAGQYVIDRLQQDAANIMTAIKKDGAQWLIEENRVSSVYKRVRSGRYFILLWSDGELRSRSLWDWHPEVKSLSPGQQVSAREEEYGDQVWITWQQGINIDNTDLTVWVAEDITALEQQLNRYSYYLGGLMLLLILLILFFQRVLLRRGFSTLQPLQDSLGRGQISGAINMPEGVPEEIKPLADAIHKLLKHSEEQLSRSRMATGNLAHELKLPLQQLQMIAADTEHPQQHQIEEVYQLLKRRIDRELKRARISGSPAPGELFNAAQELPFLIRLLNQGGNKALEPELNVPQTPLPFDRDDMLELLGNLLDNAWRYAARQVAVTIIRDRECWIIEVSDDGPGIPGAELERMLNRGEKADEQSDKNFGLGLSICQSVVKSYNGQMMLKQSLLGGLKVQIKLPQSEGGCIPEG